MTNDPLTSPLLFLRRFTALFAALLATSASASRTAEPILPSPIPAAEELLDGRLPPSLDRKILFAYRVARNEPPGEDGRHPLLGRSVRPEGLKLTLRFAHPIGEGDLAALAEVGCDVVALDTGTRAVVGPVAEAWCDWRGLKPLSALPGFVRASPTMGQQIARPLPPPPNTTAQSVEIPALRRAFHPGGARGEGVVVADMDSGFDPFHPFLFRADGGAFAWIDVNGNGAFDPGVDAVDFNRNGVADDGEILRMIKTHVAWFYGQPGLWNTDGAFVPGVDWLYQDENGDGERNQGKRAPYGDAKPTYGEQLFVADDVDLDGVLEPGERVIALKTPKVKAALSPVGFGGSLQTFRRDSNLSQVSWPSPGSEMHGAMVLGTIAGGDPRYTRYAGMAPDADLLLASTSTEDLVSSLAWARNEGARIVLWEMATWYGEFLDGSSNLEVACDAATTEGILQIGAAGNLGGSQKHRVKTLATGTEQIPLTIPGGNANWIYGNFLWRNATGAVSFDVTLNGTTIALTGLQGEASAGDAYVAWYRATSPRGTDMLLFYAALPQGRTLAGQDALFRVTNGGAPVALHGYVTDSFTSWGKGVFWPLSTGATDEGTYGTPGVGDLTLAVGTSFLDFVPFGDASGALASHSGRGPRIDGMDSVDIVAPEDHITAISGYDMPFGALMVGGGTSNASPMVTGIAAVLKGLNPSLEPMALRDAIRQNAHTEPQMGALPNDAWGYGKVRAYRAQFGGALPDVDNRAPIAVGTALRYADGTVALDASASSDPDGEALRYRWDVDYDGTFDVGPQDAPTAQALLEDAALTHLKLEVFDARGLSTVTLVPITHEAGMNPNPPDAGQPGGPGGTPVASVPNASPRLGEAMEGCGCGAGGAATFPVLVGLLALALRRRPRA